MKRILKTAIIAIAGATAVIASADVMTLNVNLKDGTKYERVTADIDSIVFDYQAVNPTPVPVVAAKHSSYRSPNDTIWFTVPSRLVLDAYDVSYEMKVTDLYKENADATKNAFTHPYENMADNIEMQRDRRRIGVVYTAPSLAAKAECALTLDNGRQRTTGSGVIHVCPEVSPGFEVNGVRPLAGPETPSNVKKREIGVDLTYAQTVKLGACIGVPSGYNTDIEHVWAWEDVDGFGWTNENTDIVRLGNQTVDWDYESGYVSYVTVTAGSIPGVAVIRYSLPGSQELVCYVYVGESK